MPRSRRNLQQSQRRICSKSCPRLKRQTARRSLSFCWKCFPPAHAWGWWEAGRSSQKLAPGSHPAASTRTRQEEPAQLPQGCHPRGQGAPEYFRHRWACCCGGDAGRGSRAAASAPAARSPPGFRRRNCIRECRFWFLPSSCFCQYTYLIAAPF